MHNYKTQLYSFTLQKPLVIFGFRTNAVFLHIIHGFESDVIVSIYMYIYIYTLCFKKTDTLFVFAITLLVVTKF